MVLYTRGVQHIHKLSGSTGLTLGQIQDLKETKKLNSVLTINIQIVCSEFSKLLFKLKHFCNYTEVAW